MAPPDKTKVPPDQTKTPANKKIVGLASVVVVLLGVIAIWHFLHRPKNPLLLPGSGENTTQNISDFDQFQQDLAARVLNLLGAGSDFSVIVATTAYPLGTLLRPTGSIPADLEDCVPPRPPTPFAAQRLFPSYTLSSNTALAANLGSNSIQGLDSAGVDLQQLQNIQYTIADTQIQIMDDKSVEQVTRQGDCGKYISAHPGMRLIRGAVIGKMSFTVKVGNPASVKAQLAKIGGFSVNDNPESSTLSIADEASEPIVELLSEFGSGENPLTPHPTSNPLGGDSGGGRKGPPPPPPSPSLVGNVPLESVPARSGPHMFVQEDVQDTPAAGAKVVQLLHAEWPSANVESQVQRIPTQKMPDVAQVRYFNQSDAGLANRCADILRKVYPNARVVRIGLPSTPGQLEVWLPKISSAK